MKFGFCLSIEDDRRIRAIKDAGYDYIELPLAHVAALDDGAFNLLAARLRELGMSCGAFNLFFPGAEIRLVGDEADSAKITDYAERAIARAAELGAKTIVLGSGGARRVPDGYDMQSASEQLADALCIAGQAAQRHGITIVLEPLNKGETNIINSVSEGLALVKQLNHPNVMLLADLYHMLVENEDLSILAEARPYLAHTHIADRPRRIPSEAAAGDINPFLTALDDIGYIGGISVEASASDDLGEFTEQAAACLALLKKGTSND